MPSLSTCSCAARAVSRASHATWRIRKPAASSIVYSARILCQNRRESSDRPSGAFGGACRFILASDFSKAKNAVRAHGVRPYGPSTIALEIQPTPPLSGPGGPTGAGAPGSLATSATVAEVATPRGGVMSSPPSAPGRGFAAVPPRTGGATPSPLPAARRHAPRRRPPRFLPPRWGFVRRVHRILQRPRQETPFFPGIPGVVRGQYRPFGEAARSARTDNHQRVAWRKKAFVGFWALLASMGSRHFGENGEIGRLVIQRGRRSPPEITAARG